MQEKKHQFLPLRSSLTAPSYSSSITTMSTTNNGHLTKPGIDGYRNAASINNSPLRKSGFDGIPAVLHQNVTDLRQRLGQDSIHTELSGT